MKNKEQKEREPRKTHYFSWNKPDAKPPSKDHWRKEFRKALFGMGFNVKQG